MKLGIIGCGYVGGAVSAAFQRCAQFIVDPKLGEATIEDLNDWKPEMVFICLPTPSKPTGEVDGSLVHDALTRLAPGTLAVVKSTITPDYLDHPHLRVVFNPEFLTQRTAERDFLYPDSLILGGALVDGVEVYNAYKHWSEVKVPAEVFYPDIKTACLVKYTLNCHFAAKVTFMNEIHRLHKYMGCNSDWEEFTQILAADHRLGHSHLQVPGPDGFYGYGGACFPKDTTALYEYARKNNIHLEMLAATIFTNGMIRKKAE